MKDSTTLSGWFDLRSLGKGLASLIERFDIQNRRLRLILGALIIFALIFIVYRPILPGSFLMDDSRLIGSDNPLVNGELTPRSLWFQTDFTLTTLVWRWEGLWFGDNPAGYHVVNMVLQGISAFLLWRLLARLKIPGAWLAAAIFAVHPVCVNSVARVAELKNTLSLPFFLLSFWAYLQYEALALYPVDRKQKENHRATLWLTVSLIAFVLSLLSKTTAVMLPVVLLLCAAWQRGRTTLRDWLHTVPYFILALAFGLMTVWFQKHQALADAGQTLPPANFGQRLAEAGQNFWFYLGKAFLPVHLSTFYVRGGMGATTPAAFLPALLVGAVFLFCWRYRRRWGRHALFGLGCFAVVLFPALGFFDAQFLEMLRISDHLQYMALIALMALAAAVMASRLPPRAFFGTAVALLLVLSVLTFQRAQVFAMDETLLRDTLAKDPAAWPAHNDLGIILAKRGDMSGATNHFMLSLQYHPDDSGAHENLAHAFVLQGKFAEADAQYLAALKIKPYAAQTHKAYAQVLEIQGRNREAIYHLQVAILFKPDAETRLELASLYYASGDPHRAVAQFHQVLRLQPDQVEALNNLAWILATCPDDTVRDGKEAVRCAEQACRLTAYKRVEMVTVLAAAYAEAGNFSQAVSTADMAVRMATAAGNTRFATINQQLLLFYRTNKPWRESPAGRENQ
ncbi:MAG TPA: tetratricopeptide repeat protein [Verrucomicrobiae bacterium]|nr:tetratricopeptide repeat protein [Verrucomicrobiae bacterium]